MIGRHHRTIAAEVGTCENPAGNCVSVGAATRRLRSTVRYPRGSRRTRTSWREDASASAARTSTRRDSCRSGCAQWRDLIVSLEGPVRQIRCADGSWVRGREWGPRTRHLGRILMWCFGERIIRVDVGSGRTHLSSSAPNFVADEDEPPVSEDVRFAAAATQIARERFAPGRDVASPVKHSAVLSLPSTGALCPAKLCRKSFLIMTMR